MYAARMARPMRIIQHMRWYQEQAAATIQRWVLLFHSGRVFRTMKKAVGCRKLQGNVRMWLARRQVQHQRNVCAARRIQTFWRVEVSMRWRRHRLRASLLLQSAVRCWVARRRMGDARQVSDVRQAIRWQAFSFAGAVLRDSYRAYTSRNLLRRLALARHVEHVVAPLIKRIVRGHLGRRASYHRKLESALQLRETHALQLQCCLRQHIARRALLQHFKDQLSRHRAAFRLDAVVRRCLESARYQCLLSGDTAVKCVQRAWRQRHARKVAAARRLLPLLQRPLASKISPFFLVRVAELQAGLARDSLCLHCLQLVASGHSTLACTLRPAGADSGARAEAGGGGGGGEGGGAIIPAQTRSPQDTMTHGGTRAAKVGVGYGYSSDRMLV